MRSQTFDQAGKLISEVDVPDAPVPVPDQVTMADARIVLGRAGLLDKVDAAIASMEGDARLVAENRWEYSTVIRRDSAWVNALGKALGLTPEQVDDLFRAAGSIDL